MSTTGCVNFPISMEHVEAWTVSSLFTEQFSEFKTENVFLNRQFFVVL